MKNRKIVLAILLLVILLDIIIEIYYKEYIILLNILFPIIISVLIPWLLFEYQFKRQNIAEQIKEKLKIYNKLYWILKEASKRFWDEEEELTYYFYDFTDSEILEVREIFRNNGHLLSPKICALWENIVNDSEGYNNKKSYQRVDFHKNSNGILIPLMMDDDLLKLIKKELTILQKKDIS